MKFHTKIKWVLAAALLFLSFNSLRGSSFVFQNDVWTVHEQGFEYFQTRPALEKKGINFLINYIFDFDWPARGGIQTRNFPVNQYLLDIQLGIETEKLISLKGGRFFINFQYHQTDYPSLKYVGDWQGFDNLESPNLIQLGQLWYQQKLFNDRVSIRFGKTGAAVIFNYIAYAQVLINNSFSEIPTLIALPSYPDQAVGIILQYSPVKWFSFNTSIFDASSALGIITGEKGARRFFNNLGKHALLMNEFDFEWGILKGRHPGKCGLGVWGLTDTLTNFQGNSVHGTAGTYFTLSQTLWKEEPFSKKKHRKNLRECGVFSQWGICNKEIYDVKQYLGFGALINNVSSHLKDSLSIGMATVLFSNATGAFYPKHFEMALEATYQISLLDYFQIQPDFQYIIHPGGQGLRNAIVGTLRVALSI